MELNNDLTLGELRDARASLAASVEKAINREIRAFYERTKILPEIDFDVGLSIDQPPHYFVTVKTQV